MLVKGFLNFLTKGSLRRQSELTWQIQNFFETLLLYLKISKEFFTLLHGTSLSIFFIFCPHHMACRILVLLTRD